MPTYIYAYKCIYVDTHAHMYVYIYIGTHIGI